MMILISPTKQMSDSLDSGAKLPFPLTEPVFQGEAKTICSTLQKLSTEQLGIGMKTKEALTLKAQKLLKQFTDQDQPSLPALFAYRGTVFRELSPENLSGKALKYGRKHLRILSAMYGILKPFDGIRPYRLEAKTPLALPPHKNLYHFWKEPLNRYIEEESQLHSNGTILNLASQEYSKLLDRKKISSSIISLHFKEHTPAGIKTKGIYAKMARGKALNRILSDPIEHPEELKCRDLAGYRYSAELSSNEDWIFLRKMAFIESGT